MGHQLELPGIHDGSGFALSDRIEEKKGLAKIGLKELDQINHDFRQKKQAMRERIRAGKAERSAETRELAQAIGYIGLREPSYEPPSSEVSI